MVNAPLLCLLLFLGINGIIKIRHGHLLKLRSFSYLSSLLAIPPSLVFLSTAAWPLKISSISLILP